MGLNYSRWQIEYFSLLMLTARACSLCLQRIVPCLGKICCLGREQVFPSYAAKTAFHKRLLFLIVMLFFRNKGLLKNLKTLHPITRNIDKHKESERVGV